MAKDVKQDQFSFDQDRPAISRFDENTRKFITSKTVTIQNDVHEHQWQHYQLPRRHESSALSKVISPTLTQSASSYTSSLEQATNHPASPFEETDVSEELRALIEQHLPDVCHLDGEPAHFVRGTKFYCTVKDILTSEGGFWVERELTPDNERKFRQFVDILALVAVSYQSLTQVYVGQLVGLYYESCWHRALVVSKSEGPTATTPRSARVRLVDYGSSLYVNVSQLKWLPEQFYLFPFKAVECVFSEAVKPTFSDTIRLTFKQLVINRRLRATVCKIDEGIINIYRYLRAHEHKSQHGRTLADGEIVRCLRNTILSSANATNSFDQSTTSNRTTSITLPILTPPTPIKLNRNQLAMRRAEINQICRAPADDKSPLPSRGLRTGTPAYSPSSQGTPFSAGTVVTPMPHLSLAPH